MKRTDYGENIIQHLDAVSWMKKKKKLINLNKISKRPNDCCSLNLSHLVDGLLWYSSIQIQFFMHPSLSDHQSTRTNVSGSSSYVIKMPSYQNRDSHYKSLHNGNPNNWRVIIHNFGTGTLTFVRDTETMPRRKVYLLKEKSDHSIPLTESNSSLSFYTPCVLQRLETLNYD